MADYGRIREVAEVPNLPRNSRWRELQREIALRLEQTPRNVWLEIPFSDGEELRCARVALWKWFLVNIGAHAVETRVRKNSHDVRLYVRRGKNYK